MKLAAQVVITCLMLGSLYTLLVLGLSLVFSIMRIVNFAHAQMYMLGAYVVYWAYGEAGVNYVLALAAAAVVVGLFGVVIERVVIAPVHGDQSRAMVSTLGLLLLLGGLALVLFSEQNRYVDAPVTGEVVVGGAVIDVTKLVVAVTGLALTFALVLALKRTVAGRAVRAVAANQVAAQLQGIRVGTVRSAGFGVGAGLAAIAGGLILPLTALNPYIGEPMILKMFIILILGGLGSISGAIAGAFTLAAFETAGVTYLGQGAILGVYLLVIGLLMARPSGILAHE